MTFLSGRSSFMQPVRDASSREAQALPKVTFSFSEAETIIEKIA